MEEKGEKAWEEGRNEVEQAWRIGAEVAGTEEKKTQVCKNKKKIQVRTGKKNPPQDFFKTILSNTFFNIHARKAKEKKGKKEKTTCNSVIKSPSP